MPRTNFIILARSSVQGAINPVPLVTDVSAGTPEVTLDSNQQFQLSIPVSFKAPADPGSDGYQFCGVEIFVQGDTVDSAGQFPFTGSPGEVVSITIGAKYPKRAATYYIYVCSKGTEVQNPLVLHDQASATPYATVDVAPFLSAPDVLLFDAGQVISGTCSTSGTTVTLDTVQADTDWNDAAININGTAYTISTALGSTLTLTESAGEQSGVPFVINVPRMYRDPSRQYMLIDLRCAAPRNRINWSGVQAWIFTLAFPTGIQATATISGMEATGPASGEFILVSGTNLYVLNYTLSFAVGQIPVSPEAWTIKMASLDKFGNLNTDENGLADGPSVTLQTLAQSDYVESFTVELMTGTTEAGTQTWGLTGSWTDPPQKRYVGVRIIIRGMLETDTVLMDLLDNETSFTTAQWPMPAETKACTVYASPIFGDGSVAAINDSTPHQHLNIGRTIGTSGAEYTPNVTAFSAAVASPAYATNGQGQKVLRVDLTFTPPNDITFGGVICYVIWYDAVTYQLSGTIMESPFRVELQNYPESAQNVTFYLLGQDTSNRKNTYVAGVTPASTISLPAPIGATTGQEYTQNVTGFAAAVSNPVTADGTYPSIVTITFTPPADVTWGGIEILEYDTVAGTYKSRGKTAKSPYVFNVPTPFISAQTFTYYGVGYDVNGHSNTYPTGTPSANVLIGAAAGSFDATKMKATTYDSNIFTTASGSFTIWAFNGSIITSGTVSSAALNTAEISVGGGGGKPGKFGVYNALGQQIGFIGVDGSYQGAWFKQFAAGGTSAANAPLKTDVNGALTLSDYSISVTSGASTTTISTGYTGVKVDGGAGKYAHIYDGYLQYYYSNSLRVQIGPGTLDDETLILLYDSAGHQAVITPSSIQLAGSQVLGAQQAGPGNAAGWADATAQAWANTLLTALRNHGLVT